MSALGIGLLVAAAYAVGFFVGRWAYIKYGDHSLITGQQKQNPQSTTDDCGFEDLPGYRHGGVRAAG